MCRSRNSSLDVFHHSYLKKILWICPVSWTNESCKNIFILYIIWQSQNIIFLKCMEFFYSLSHLRHVSIEYTKKNAFLNFAENSLHVVTSQSKHMKDAIYIKKHHCTIVNALTTTPLKMTQGLWRQSTLKPVSFVLRCPPKVPPPQKCLQVDLLVTVTLRFIYI